MTRQEALEAAVALLLDQDCGNADLPALASGTWGQLAEFVLDKTGRTDLADAIWEGR